MRLLLPLLWLDENTRIGSWDTQWLPRLVERVTFGRYDSSYDFYNSETGQRERRK